MLNTTGVGFRTNEGLCYLSYETPYLGTEGGRPGKPKQAVRYTCSRNLGIVKILHYNSSDKLKIAPHKQNSIVKNFFDRKMPPPGQRDPVLKHTLAQW